MTTHKQYFDPALDLVLERTINVAPHKVWAAWTQPEQIKKWFCPAPWTTTEAEIELHPGGIFRTVMRSPEGQDFPNMGCVLEAVENKRLVWTSALGPGFRPSNTGITSADDLLFTAIISIEPHNGGAKYTAIARHADPETAKKHEAMGFHAGWGLALDQLVALMSA